jgi:hypothetical protein
MPKNTSAFGIYPNGATVSDATAVLQQAGFRATDIAVLLAENQGSKDFAHEKKNKAGQGAATGAAAGAVLCAVLGWLAAAGTLTIPGLQPFLPANPVVAALAGAGLGGLLGWLTGLLVGLGGSEYVAKRYAGRIRHGGILLSVHCDTPEWSNRAKKALKDSGAQNISCAAESAGDYATTDRPTERPRPVLEDRGEAPGGRPVAVAAHVDEDRLPHE